MSKTKKSNPADKARNFNNDTNNINGIENRDKEKKENSLNEERVSEVAKKVDNNTGTLSIPSDELKVNKVIQKKRKHIVVNLFLVLLLLVALCFFGISIYNVNAPISALINSLILTLFTIMFAVGGITSSRRNKTVILMGGLLLLGYVSFQVVNSLYSIKAIDNFSGKALVDVMEWAEENKIKISQEYEYSDMIDEYMVISQNVKSGTLIDKVKELIIAVSEGPNPAKEIIIPDMVTWDSERVLKFIKENYLSNVEVEFVESEKMQDTVIEQSASGNLKRNDKIKLTFSYGEELGYEEVKIIDFRGMTKFEVEFYMRQHQLKYEFDHAFSNKVKKDKAIKQSVKAGKTVKINDEKIKVTLSKGPKIKVPNLKKMSISEITEWAMKNKLKVEFSDTYDDSVKENAVVNVNFKKNEVVEQGTVVKVVLSRGSLKMPKFKSFNAFREWADKYEIKYEEKHEFNDSVKAGEVISYSYKSGETIKNNDSITVKISDGKKCEVPNLKGLSKSEAISKLEKANLNYNFVSRASNSVKKNYVISQSMGAGSEVSEGTTVTVTLSNGKKESTSSSSYSGKNNSSSGSSSNKNNNSSSGSSSSSKPATQTCDTSKGEYFFVGAGNTGEQVLSSTQRQNPRFKVTANYVDSCPNGSSTRGSVCNNSVYDEKWVSYCTTVNLTIVR